MKNGIRFDTYEHNLLVIVLFHFPFQNVDNNFSYLAVISV